MQGNEIKFIQLKKTTFTLQNSQSYFFQSIVQAMKDKKSWGTQLAKYIFYESKSVKAKKVSCLI